MKPQAEVFGVHVVAGSEPCHLIEMVVRGWRVEDFDFIEVTQRDRSLPPSSWQVAYEEQVLEQTDNETRFAFFFHYLNMYEPLLTPAGPINLPEPTPVPAHLEAVASAYEPPD
jgi:hypothetical protein